MSQIASRWPSPSGQQSFIDLMHAFETYARSFRLMWPFFWLKAAAVKLDGTWHLAVFSLSDQWSDDRQAAPVEPPFEALAVVSKRLDAASAWQMVESLVATKTVELAEGVVAWVPEVFVSPSVRWQEKYPTVPDLVSDVAEPATWWYLNVGDRRQWLSDSARQAQVYAAIKPTLDYLSEESYESFISARFAGQRPARGGFLSIDNFTYHLDLPLALRMNVSAYLPADAARRIEVDCHTPLRLGELTITQGDISLPGAQALTIEEDASFEGGWTIGHASVAATTSKLRITSPQLGRIIAYEFSVPTIPELAADMVARLYAPHEPVGKGAEKWKRDLLTGDGPAFEVALLNALVRLGIPVLFGGQIMTPEGQAGGTATPGLDLVALDHRHRRAVAISAKGAAKLPKREDLENLRQAVQGLRLVLPDDWTVFGLVACHAPQSDLANWHKPADMNVWGPAELGWLIQASTAQAVAGLLWIPPWASEAERRLFQMTMQGGMFG